MAAKSILRGQGLWLGLALLLGQAATVLAVNIQADVSLVPTASPAIDIWYGTTQSFGSLGNPQTMINIPGNVYDADGISSLAYRLNGGSWNELSWKDDSAIISSSEFMPSGMTNGVQSEDGLNGDGNLPGFNGVTAASNNPRLVSPGDFNIEIDFADLTNGSNTVAIRAEDTLSNLRTVNVTVNYDAGNTWPLPYTIDWSSAGSVADVAQIVDGEWAVTGGNLRPSVTGYDRLVAIGDIYWDDFQVTLPITIHDFPQSNTGGVGVLARWQGHFVESSEQPGTGWWDLGGYGYYRNRSVANGGPHLALRTGQLEVVTDYSVSIPIDVPYYYKMRVQTKTAGQSGFYSFKVWPVGQPEPASWNFEIQDAPPDEMFTGSVLLVAHEADASFGDVSILPVLDVEVNTVGNGTVDMVPQLNGVSDVYLYGDVITLTATADPDWIFTGWNGDLSGNDNPATLTLTDDTSITAVFAPAHSLTINVVGNGGDVIADPTGPIYSEGTTVTLTAAADSGWSFVDWSGDLSGSDTPETLTMDEDKVVTATFTEDAYTLDIASVGNGAVTVMPAQPAYRYGEVVTLTATADPGWSFTSWSGDLSGSATLETLTMDEDKVVTATFTEDAYTLDITLIGNGTVTAMPTQPTYRYGEVVTLTVTADLGWSFSGWSGDLSGSANPTSLIIDADKSVTALLKNYTLFLPVAIRP